MSEDASALVVKVAALASRHENVPSPVAAAELLALVEQPAAPLPIDNELVAALRQRDWAHAQELLSSAAGSERRPLAGPGALVVDDEPALAYLLRREAALPILSRKSGAIATAQALCERGVDVGRGRDGVPPLVYAARFRDASLCRCIVAKHQSSSDRALALLELLDYGRNRGWSVALSRSLMVVPAGGGSRAAFDTDVMRSAMAASAPLRRLHKAATAARSPAQITVRARDVGEANEAWVLTTAAELLATSPNDNSSSLLLELVATSSRDAFGRTVLHLAAMNGWPQLIDMLRIPAGPEQSDCRRQQQEQQQQEEEGGEEASFDQVRQCDASGYLPTALALAVDVFGRTALHLAASRGDSTVVEVLTNATSPTDRSALLAASDVGGAVHSDYLQINLENSDNSTVSLGQTTRAKTAGPKTGRDTGGYDPTPLQQAIRSGCQFESVDYNKHPTLTAEQFTSRYLLRSKPLLIRNAVSDVWIQYLSRASLLGSNASTSESAAHAWQSRGIWSQAELAAGEIPYGSQFGVASTAVRLAEFIQNLDNDSNRASPARPPAVVFHPFPVKNAKPASDVALPRNWGTFTEHMATAVEAEAKANTMMEEVSRTISYSVLISPAAVGGAEQTEKLRRAAALYKKAISHSLQAPPEESEWLRLRARCHAARSTCFVAMRTKVDKALSEAEMAVRLDPSLASAFEARCVVYYLQEQLSEALRDCTVALKLLDATPVEESAQELQYSSAMRQRMEEIVSRIESDLRTKPLLALNMLLFGDGTSLDTQKGDGSTDKTGQESERQPTQPSLPWFLRADAVASVAAKWTENKTIVAALNPIQKPEIGSGMADFEIRAAVRQFFVGERGGGAPAHPHSHAVNSLAYGTKRWRLWRPAESYFAAASPWSRWEEQQGRGGLECTQEAGDIMYVPASWGHAVLNVRDSVGVTVEFDVRKAGEEL